METDFLPLDLPLIVYTGADAPQTEEVTPSSVSNFVFPQKVCSTLQQAASLDEISQYYVFPGNQDNPDFIVYDAPRDSLPFLQTQSYHSQVNVVHCRPFSLLELQVNLIIWEQRCLCPLTGISICWKIC